MMLSLGFLKYLGFLTICKRLFLNRGFLPSCLDRLHVLFNDVNVLNTGEVFTLVGQDDTKQRFNTSHKSSGDSDLQVNNKSWLEGQFRKQIQ